MLSRILAIVLTLTVLATVVEAEDTETSASNRLSLFIVQTTRKKETLERDFELIGTFLQDAEIGDEIQCITTTGQNVFQYHLAMKKMNPVRARQAQNQAIAELTAFFVQLLKEPPKEDAENNIAEAIALALERVNVAEPYQQYTLVILSSGFQVAGVIDWRGYYPTPSWIAHQLSPFSQIPRNLTKGKFDCIIVPERGDYINAYHKRKIQQWYSWLFGHKAVDLIAFTFDHNSASETLKRGARPTGESSKPPNFNGDLELIEVGRLAPADQ